MRCSSATHRLSALLLTDATPMLIRAGPPAALAGAGSKQSKLISNELTKLFIGSRKD
jgi:hypothetical protein